MIFDTHTNLNAVFATEAEKPPALSVICKFWNGPNDVNYPGLQRAIECFQAQAYSGEKEMVIVDTTPGKSLQSPDGTEAQRRVNALVSANASIKYIHVPSRDAFPDALRNFAASNPEIDTEKILNNPPVVEAERYHDPAFVTELRKEIVSLMPAFTHEGVLGSLDSFQLHNRLTTGEACNLACTLAKGEVIVAFDDDFYPKSYLRNIAEIFQNPAIQLARFSDTFAIVRGYGDDNDGWYVKSVVLPVADRSKFPALKEFYGDGSAREFKSAQIDDFLTMLSPMGIYCDGWMHNFRKSAWEKTPFLPITAAEDVTFGMRIHQKHGKQSFALVNPFDKGPEHALVRYIAFGAGSSPNHVNSERLSVEKIPAAHLAVFSLPSTPGTNAPAQGAKHTFRK